MCGAYGLQGAVGLGTSRADAPLTHTGRGLRAPLGQISEDKHYSNPTPSRAQAGPQTPAREARPFPEALPGPGRARPRAAMLGAAAGEASGREGWGWEWGTLLPCALIFPQNVEINQPVTSARVRAALFGRGTALQGSTAALSSQGMAHKHKAMQQGSPNSRAGDRWVTSAGLSGPGRFRRNKKQLCSLLFIYIYNIFLEQR